MDTTVEITCKCGWYREAMTVTDRKVAEVIADRHETADYRRPYRHDTMIVEVAG